jgi:integrase
VELKRGVDPMTGKPRRLSRNIRGTKREAESVLAHLLLEAGARPDSNMSLKEYLEDVWLPAVRETVRTRTADEYLAKCDLYIIPQLGRARLGDIEPYDLDRWLARLTKEVSRQTALHAYRVLCNALNRAVRWRLIASNPMNSVDAPSVERSKPDVLTIEEAGQYLEAFAGHPLEPIVVIAIAAGLRRSELAALTWRDVNLKAGTVSVSKGLHERSGQVWTEPPKSKTSRRVVSLPSWAVEALRSHRSVGPLVVEDGEAMKPNRISILYIRHVKHAGLRRVPLKNLRHTSATIALSAHVDVVSISRRLGHSSIAVTDRFYLAPGDEADAKAAEAMELVMPKMDQREAK